MGKLHIYSKLTDDLDDFDAAIHREQWDEILITRESTYSYELYDSMLQEVGKQDAVLIHDVISLGKHVVDMMNRLHWYIENERMLVIVDRQSTYEYGVNQPMNVALLKMMEQNLLTENQASLEINRNRHTNAGRRRAEYPDQWREFYEQWKAQKISSKEFLQKSGLKRATFYNLLADYQQLEKQEQEFVQRHNIS